MRHVTSATPVVLSGALVIPAGLLRTLRGEPAAAGSAFSTDPEARSRIEQIAMGGHRFTNAVTDRPSRCWAISTPLDPRRQRAKPSVTLTVAVSAERAGVTTIATQIINGERVQVQRRRTPLLAVRVRISPVVHHPASDCANIRASTSICLRRVLSRFTGIESPCFNAFRLERALPAEVFGPRPSEPLRRLAAICLSVAILRFPQWF